MSEFKGTKGKWELELFNGKGNVIDIVSDEKSNGETIAQVFSLVDTDYKTPFNDEILANAKLIACAPELLDVVIELHSLLEEHLPNWYLRKHDNLVKNIIQKATK